MRPTLGAGLLRQEVLEAITGYPELYLVERETGCVVRGSFPIGDVSGLIDRFAVEIMVPADYPRTLPKVREVAGRIPWLPDRHCNFDGTACLVVPEEWQALAEDQSFAGFLEGPMKNYFVGQALVERGQPWPCGERAHGIDGVVEAFSGLLGFIEKAQQVAALRLLAEPIVAGHQTCPCGSERPIRQCHLAQVRAAQRKIPTWLADRMLVRLGVLRSVPVPRSKKRSSIC